MKDLCPEHILIKKKSSCISKIRQTTQLIHKHNTGTDFSLEKIYRELISTIQGAQHHHLLGIYNLKPQLRYHFLCTRSLQ